MKILNKYKVRWKVGKEFCVWNLKEMEIPFMLNPSNSWYTGLFHELGHLTGQTHNELEAWKIAIKLAIENNYLLDFNLVKQSLDYYKELNENTYL